MPRTNTHSHARRAFYDYYENGMIPFVRYRNADAPYRKKILVLKDSFAMPVAAFLCTQFSAVDVIDPRKFAICDIPSYVLATKPDAVLLMCNITAHLYPERQIWGDVGGTLHEWRTIAHAEAAQIRSSDNNRYYNKMMGFDADGETFRLAISRVKVLSGMPKGLTISIQDAVSKKEVVVDTFSISHLERTGDPIIFAFGGLKKGKYCVLIFGGERGKTKGVGLRLEGVTLESLGKVR